MNVEIAERLARRRREAGYSQESLAEKLGVSRQAVSKWERSESSPDTDNLIALAQLYEVSIDDLLYAEENIKDDIAFEAADRAATHKTETAYKATADTSGFGTDGPGVRASSQAEKEGANGSKEDSSVHLGFDGIHVSEGDDYVHVSWKDGVHVKDSETGEEVHVGLGGIHIREGKHRSDKDAGSSSPDNKKPCEDWTDAKVIVNGEEYNSWHDAEVMFKDKYDIEKAWMKFPFPLVAIIAYLLLGFILGAWATGLFVFFSIPVYYMIGHAIYSKRIGHFLEGLYPLASIIWFVWMAFVLGQPHPAWVIFLTIPVVEWIVHAISKKYRKRKREAEIAEVKGVDEEEGSSS